MDGTVGRPAERSMSGSIGVVAINAVWLKAGSGAGRWKLCETVRAHTILFSSSRVLSVARVLDPEVACEL